MYVLPCVVCDMCMLSCGMCGMCCMCGVCAVCASYLWALWVWVMYRALVACCLIHTYAYTNIIAVCVADMRVCMHAYMHM